MKKWKKFNVMFNITINVVFYDCASNTNLEHSVLLAKQHKSSVMCSTEREEKIKFFSLAILTTPQRFYCTIP